jgi:hypothetical protein
LGSIGLENAINSVVSGAENPCVGGSIPPQATSVYAPQRPIRVLGRFYFLGRLSTISFGHLWQIPRSLPVPMVANSSQVIAMPD